MANHVYFNIQFNEVDKDKVFKTELTKQWVVEIETPVEAYEQPFMANVEKTLDKDGWLEDSYDWHIDNIGAKWVTLDEVDETSLSGYSAWSPPIQMLGHFSKFIGQATKMTYEDEFRNFIGVAWGDTDGDTHWEEHDNVVELFLDKVGWEVLPEYYDWQEEIEVDGTKHIASELMDDLVYQWFEDQ
tara:strand:+ start:69 stop:626 length:558 start_codon:yes stop_codon:yes gene_type:complete